MTNDDYEKLEDLLKIIDRGNYHKGAMLEQLKQAIILLIKDALDKNRNKE